MKSRNVPRLAPVLVLFAATSCGSSTPTPSSDAAAPTDLTADLPVADQAPPPADAPPVDAPPVDAPPPDAASDAGADGTAPDAATDAPADAPRCLEGMLRCGDDCIPPNDFNCGGCGVMCPIGQECVANACRPRDGGAPCPISQTLCGATCVNVRFSNQHCGRCDNACAAGQMCVGNECVTPSTCGKLLRCNEACVNQFNDNNHCGRCNNVCPVGTRCTSGNCR